MALRAPNERKWRVDTLRLSVDPEILHTKAAREALARAADILRSGGLVAIPTETVYGLGANALDAAAVARIFSAKRRPSWDPVIVHIAGPNTAENPMLQLLVNDLPEPASRLIAAFWPGPLTLLLPRSSAVPDAVTAGRSLVGIRMPSHPVARELIRLAGVPIAAPSANLFSHTSPTTAEHVLHDLDGRIDAVVDAGPAQSGLESTVLDPCQTPMVIYRPGAVTPAQIRSIAGEVQVFEIAEPLPLAPRESLPSPGIGMRHYAPKARLILIESPLQDLSRRIAESASAHSAQRVGLMLPTECASAAPAGAVVFPWGCWSAPDELAHRIYAGLRDLDAQDCSVIICPLPPEDGLGAAIRDRLRKAAWEDPF